MKILGIFRGFPGLGRVVSGVALLETLRDEHNCEVKAVSYLQGNKYLRQRGFWGLQEASAMDFCSIGLLPTNKMGVHIHSTIKNFQPDLIIVDGEPLIIQSIKISHPKIRIVTLLNPSDLDNPTNDPEAMDYFNTLYSMSDLAIVHGLRSVSGTSRYSNLISIPTIIRKDIISLNKKQGNNIYCVLGGGTVNSHSQFIDASVKIAELCLEAAINIEGKEIHIICSCDPIASILRKKSIPSRVIIHDNLLSPKEIYSDASLIITRSGRNTLSEVAYLGIPTITFVTGDCYRIEEQRQNIQSLNCQNVIEADLTLNSTELLEKIQSLLSMDYSLANKFSYGNDTAISAIRELISTDI